MEKVTPLNNEQLFELNKWVNINRELINEIYIPQFNEKTKYYENQKLYICGSLVSDDLYILRQNYLYNKMKSQQNGTN